MSIRSMTGFARARRAFNAGEAIVSLKSVNHRGLDLHFHLPAELDAIEPDLRAALKAGLARGHVQIHVGVTRTAAAGGASLNRPLLDAYMSAFREAAKAYGIDAKPDLNSALRVPGMIAPGEPEDTESDLTDAVLQAACEALAELNAFREREGAAIAGEMKQRCANIGELVDRIKEIRSGATVAFQNRLRERLSDLLRGAGIEPQRLAQEAALLADRSDVAEELVRLQTHTGQVEKMLSGSGEVGKRLDFLLQEMNREANTILSKTGGLGDLGLTITELALSAKSEIDKIREQSLNLE